MIHVKTNFLLSIIYDFVSNYKTIFSSDLIRASKQGLEAKIIFCIFPA